MSKTAKTILVLIILIAVIAIIWTYIPKSNNAGENQSPESSYVASTTDTSNTAINQDISNVDAQLNDLNSDEASLDATSSNQ